MSTSTRQHQNHHGIYDYPAHKRKFPQTSERNNHRFSLAARGPPRAVIMRCMQGNSYFFRSSKEIHVLYSRMKDNLKICRSPA